MIYDCFTLAYEVDALEVRLCELAPVVDRFVIVEGTTDFHGAPREPLWPALAETERFAPWRGRAYHEVLAMPGQLIPDPWAQERFARDGLKDAVKLAGAYEDDWVIVSDADEIPHPDTIRAVAARDRPARLHVDYRELYADWRAPDEWQPLHQPFMARLGEIDSVETWRTQTALHLPLTGPRGWHLSSMGSVESIAQKLRSFAHASEIRSHYTTPGWINHCRFDGIDILDRFKLEPTADLPWSLFADRERFRHLLREG